MKPAYIAYTVIRREDDKKDVWTKIGAAWPQDKSNGFNIKLEALPLDGRIVLVEPKEDDNKSTESTA